MKERLIEILEENIIQELFLGTGIIPSGQAVADVGRDCEVTHL